MKQVLIATQTTSDTWTAQGRIMSVAVGQFQEGTNWVVQYYASWGEWIETDITFGANGIKDMTAVVGGRYRLTGGTVGALAEVDGAI